MSWKGGGAWGGGGGKGWGKAAPAYPAWGIPGLNEALAEALAPISAEEPDLHDVIRKIFGRAVKVSEKYAKDERCTQKLAPTAAQALIEEFVESVMGSLSAVVYDKEWFSKVNFTQPLLIVVLHTFASAKIFSRTLKPQVIKYIEDGFFKWQEEDRVLKAMQAAVAASGIKEEYHKKANQSLTKAYDEAHFKAPYGTTHNDSPELAVLQDFVKGWMLEFAGRAWDVLENGTDGSREAQVSLISELFQNLLDPNVACMPAEIATEVTNALGGLPASPWLYIGECSASVFIELENQNQGGGKRRKMGK